MKKGFTLVELLVVISLIALLAVVAIPSALVIQKRINQKSLDSKIELIESGAILYGQNNKSKISSSTEFCNIKGSNYKCKKITISDLIKNDFLDSESKNNISLINPTNDKEMIYNLVYVYIKNKMVYAKYSDEIYYNIKSSDNKDSGSVHFADFDLEIIGLGDIKYSWDNHTYQNYNSAINVDDSKHNKTLYVKIGSEWEGTYNVKFDLVNPIIDIYDISYNISNSLATLRVEAHDEDDYIKDYKFTTDSSCTSGMWENANKKSINKSYVFTNISNQNREYYVCIRDNANHLTKKSLYVANCQVNGSYICAQELKSYLIFWSKWESLYNFSINSNNGKDLYLYFQLNKEDVTSFDGNDKIILPSSSLLTHSIKRKKYKNGCDDLGSISIYTDSTYTQKCYEVKYDWNSPSGTIS